MLKFLSKMERTRSLIIIGFAILMAISLVVGTGLLGNTRGAAPKAAGTDVVATVGSDEITVGDLTGNLAAQGGDESMLSPQIAQLLLKPMIRQRVMVQEAKRLGMTASDEELAAKIRELNKDASGQVDVQKYMNRVGDVTRYEESVRDSIAGEKLRALITAGVNVSEEELQALFQRQRAVFNLVYVPVSADKLAAKINPSEQELRDYYEQRKENFRVPGAQKKIRYLFIDQAKMGEKIQIPEAELRAEYDQLKPEAKEGGHRVQQIVLKVANANLDATVKGKADELAAKARGTSGSATEQEFADLAKGHSEDPATAQNGGFIAGVVRKNPNKPDDPLQRTFETTEGGISGPIKYGNAYYIFRRGETVPKTFEEAKQELLVSLRNRKAYSAAAALATRAAERLKATKDFQAVAKELAAEANMNPAQMVIETPFVAKGDEVPKIGSNQQFEQAIEPLQNVGDIGERTPVPGGFSIPSLIDKREPNQIPEFGEIKEKVTKAFRDERAKAQLDETARNLAASASTAADLKAAAEKLGLEAKTEDGYRSTQPIADMDESVAAGDVIYGMKEGEVTRTPIRIGKDWYVIGVTKRTEADLADFAKLRDSMMQSALTERRTQVFEDYITAAQSRMEADGTIKIYDDVLASLTTNEPAVASPPPPSQPPGGQQIEIPVK